MVAPPLTAEVPLAAPGIAGEIRQAASFGLAADGPHILGAPVLSAAQMAGWFASTGARPRTTVPLSDLIADYLAAGRLTGVRGDLAFAQSVVETGYFSFPAGGQLAPKNNNFAGIGACDSCKHGRKFPSAMTGVWDQEALLSEYAGSPPVPGAIGAGGVTGCCATWMSLAGVWATNPAYGFEIPFGIQGDAGLGLARRTAPGGIDRPGRGRAPGAGGLARAVRRPTSSLPRAQVCGPGPRTAGPKSQGGGGGPFGRSAPPSRPNPSILAIPAILVALPAASGRVRRLWVSKTRACDHEREPEPASATQNRLARPEPAGEHDQNRLARPEPAGGGPEPAGGGARTGWRRAQNPLAAPPGHPAQR